MEQKTFVELVEEIKEAGEDIKELRGIIERQEYDPFMWDEVSAHEAIAEAEEIIMENTTAIADLSGITFEEAEKMVADHLSE